MRVFTAHLRRRSAPELVREGFSLGALVFGPLWLFAHRAWLAGVLGLCAAFLIVAAVPAPLRGIGLGTLAWIFGLFGNDLRRWSLRRAGYRLEHVVAAPDREAALARLLANRPDLVEEALA